MGHRGPPYRRPVVGCIAGWQPASEIGCPLGPWAEVGSWRCLKNWRRL